MNNKLLPMTAVAVMAFTLNTNAGFFDDLKNAVKVDETSTESEKATADAVDTVDEVLKHALTKALKPVKWAEIDQVSAKKDEVTSRH